MVVFILVMSANAPTGVIIIPLMPKDSPMIRELAMLLDSGASSCAVAAVIGRLHPNRAKPAARRTMERVPSIKIEESSRRGDIPRVISSVGRFPIESDILATIIVRTDLERFRRKRMVPILPIPPPWVDMRTGMRKRMA